MYQFSDSQLSYLKIIKIKWPRLPQHYDKLIDLEMDREWEKNDEAVIDECEAAADQLDWPEFEADDLALEPISVEHRREACVLLSKVHD